MELSGNSAENGEGFRGGPLNERQGAANCHQRGSRNPRPPNPLAFWRRYSVQVASARFSSETDFCSRAILMASQNEASIWGSSAPIAVRNTPRSRCSSTHHRRAPDLSTSASASFIASRASLVRFARWKASASRARKKAPQGSRRPLDNLLSRPRSTRFLQLCHQKHCAPTRGEPSPVGLTV
jgi:hypothetical protein